MSKLWNATIEITPNLPKGAARCQFDTLVTSRSARSLRLRSCRNLVSSTPSLAPVHGSCNSLIAKDIHFTANKTKVGFFLDFVYLYTGGQYS